MNNKFKFLVLLGAFLCCLSDAVNPALAQSTAPTPQFDVIYHFGGFNAIPGSELTVGTGGVLYGTTYGGAALDGTGSLFKLVPNGIGGFTFVSFYRFNTAGSPAHDGEYPFAGVTLSPDGTKLYGTTQQGGTGGGVIYEVLDPDHYISRSGGYLDLVAIGRTTQGGASQGTLKADPRTGLYFGTLTSEGPGGGGSVFSIDPGYLLNVGTNPTNPVIRVVYPFTPGAIPPFGGYHPVGSVAISNGLLDPGPKGRIKRTAANNVDLSTITLYGINKYGGSNNWGTAYSVKANGSNFVVLHHFGNSSSDGKILQGGMVLSGNTLYGTTGGGGSNHNGTVFKINTDGSGYDVIGNFAYATTGDSPGGDLIISGNTLYGTAHFGGMNGGGTVYSINTDGSSFTMLHSFQPPMLDARGNYTNSAGGWPVSGLALSGNTLFGTTSYGGTNGVGTAFEIILPAPPSLTAVPLSDGVNISWPKWASNYTLQQNSNLATTNWSTSNLAISDNGTNKNVTFAAPASNLFFRLASP